MNSWIAPVFCCSKYLTGFESLAMSIFLRQLERDHSFKNLFHYFFFFKIILIHISTKFIIKGILQIETKNVDHKSVHQFQYL